MLTLRVAPTSPWVPRTLPGRSGDTPLHWLRARLITNDYPDELRLARMTLNGVPAIAARSVRGEVLEPLERSTTGARATGSSQVPVVPGSVLIDVADALGRSVRRASGRRSSSAGARSTTSPAPTARIACFLLDAADGHRDVRRRRRRARGARRLSQRRRAGLRAGRRHAPACPPPATRSTPQRSIPNLERRDRADDHDGRRGRVARGARRCAARPRSARAAAPSRRPTTRRSRSRPRASTSLARTACPATDPRSPGSSVARGRRRRRRARRRPPRAGRRCHHRRRCAPSPSTSRARSAWSAPRSSRPRRATAGSLRTRCSSRAPAATSPLSAAPPATRSTRWLDPLHGSGGDRLAVRRARALGRADAAAARASCRLLTAVSRLALRIDGRRLPACVDAELEPGELTWPGSHIIEVVAEERAS